MTEQVQVKKVKVGDIPYVIRKENGRTILENPAHSYEIVRRSTPKKRRCQSQKPILSQAIRCKTLDLTWAIISINLLYTKEVLKKP